MLGLQGLEFLGLGLRIMGLHGFQGLGPRDLGFGGLGFRRLRCNRPLQVWVLPGS